MSVFQPKSVLQLVVIGFLVVVAPLCLAILYTVQTLGELSENSRSVTAQVITLNRHGQELQRGSGTLAVSKPNLINWTTTEPEESQIISDGETLLIRIYILTSISIKKLI